MQPSDRPLPDAPLSESARIEWDAIVVGAGPAGCVAARQLACAGVRVLLVERCRFPRSKPCGCCLSAAALDILDRLGLGRVVPSLGAQRLHSFDLHAGPAREGAHARIVMPRGAACSRPAFDCALAQEAVRAGAAMLDSTSASLVSLANARPRLLLRRGVDRAQVQARVVVAADGLAGSLLRGSEAFAGPAAKGTSVHPRSRIGLSAMLGTEPPWVAGGTIHMFAAPRGYVGAVRLEDGRVNLAAAVDPRFIAESGGPSCAIAAIFGACGEEAPDLKGVRWSATPGLTRRRNPVGIPGLFFIGDAAGYVEPFTGEGMAWALAGAAEVVPHVIRACKGDAAGAARDWNRRHRRLIASRRALACVTASALRHPAVVRAAVRIVAGAPWIGAGIARAAQGSGNLGREVRESAANRRPAVCVGDRESNAELVVATEAVS
jgi:flavin-dependent dehydrogenase